MSNTRPADTYNPLYFLASVGAGGLSVTFFMYLMFWVPHPGRPVPIFEDIAAAFDAGHLFLNIAISVAMIGIAVFSFLNIKALLWNLAALKGFKATDGYKKLTSSNAQASLLAMPLAIAMSINAMFIVGLVFVPKLWTIVEYLFPLAMVAFFINAMWALKMMGGMIARYLADKEGFNSEANNSFAQVLPAFALAMNAVGLAAPAAMSNVPTVVGTSLVLSSIFGTIAALYAIVKIIAAVPALLHHGVDRDAAPTLMIAVPLVTILSIMVLRQDHGLHTTFGAHGTAADTLMILAKGIAIQLAFLGLGWSVLKAQGYFKSYVFGHKTHVGSYALVCPGVAFSVLMHFFVNKGLVAAQIIDKFSVAYWVLSAIAIAAQVAMVALVLRLNRQHLGRTAAKAVPAE